MTNSELELLREAVRLLRTEWDRARTRPDWDLVITANLIEAVIQKAETGQLKPHAHD